MKNEYNDIDRLILKVLTGESSFLEQKEIGEWKKQNPENLKYFMDFERLLNETDRLKTSLYFDENNAWEKVRGKLFFPDVEKEERGIILPILLRIAASLTILGLAFVSLYYFFGQGQTSYYAASSLHQILTDTLPDGSKVVMNKESIVHYSETKKRRKVSLEGEAYFDLKNNPEKGFLIELSSHVYIKDIGTAFHVSDYPDKNKIEVIVDSGIVWFYSDDQNGLELQAGESAYFDKNLQAFQKIEIQDSNKLAYKTHIFSFHDTTLGAVVESLNDVYALPIKLGNENISRCKITVDFKDENIETIASILAETLNLNIILSANAIILDGEFCKN